MEEEPCGGGPRPLALVTGASSGLGRAIALELAGRGYDLLASGRDARALRALGADARRRGASVEVLAEDLTRPGAVDRLCALALAGGGPEVLVNCAGVGAWGPVHRAAWPTIDALLSLNVVVATELAARLLPGMVERRAGRLLNVASTSAFFASATSGAYNASKAYLVSLSLSLAEELRGTGVTVTTFCPGPTATPFAERAGIPPARRVGEQRAARPEVVARAAVEAMDAGRSVVVHGRLHRVAVAAARVVPPPVLSAVRDRLRGADRRTP